MAITSARRASRWRIAATAAVMVMLGWAVMVSCGDGNASPFGIAVLDAAQLRGRALRLRQEGRLDEAARLIRLSARLGWRDTQIQYWLLEDALQEQDYRSAVERIDAVLRRRPERAAQLFPILHALVMDAKGRNALLGRFADAPPWRPAFFNDVMKLDGDMAVGHEALLDQMIAGGIASARDEVLPYVRRLLVRRDYARAKDLWLRALGVRANADTLAGSFAEIDPSLPEDRISPFEWRVRRVAGAEIRPEHIGQAVGMRIVMDGSTFGTLAERAVVLKPGAYRLSSAASGEAEFRDGRIGWSLSCIPDRKKLPLEPKSPNRGALGVSFVVPASSCPAQQLSLYARRATQSGPVDMLLSTVRIAPFASLSMSARQ